MPKRRKNPLIKSLSVFFTLGGLFLLPYLFVTQFKWEDCKHTKDTIKCVKYLGSTQSGGLLFEAKDYISPTGNRLLVYLAKTHFPYLTSSRPCEKEVANQSQKFLKRYLSSKKTINLTHLKQKKSSRLLARVEIKGKSLRTVLLSKSHIRPSSDGARSTIDWCQKYVPKKLRQKHVHSSLKPIQG